MSDDAPPVADMPRKKAEVWAEEKHTPAWQLAAARLVAVWSPVVLLTESEFDAAISHVRHLAYG